MRIDQTVENHKNEKSIKHKNESWACKIMIAFVITIALAFSAFGQETNTPPADPLAPFRTDKGLISLTKVAPTMTPVWDYKGDFASRSTLFGDLDGWRSNLYDHGLTLDAQLTQVYQGVVSGGSVKGNGSGEYNGLFEANITIDTAKAGLWSGGLLLFTEQTSFGHALKSQPGSLSPVNSTALWPKAYDNSSVVMEYLLVQALPFNTVAMVGRLDPSNYLDLNSFSCTSDSQFLNVSMNSDPLFGRFLTYSVYAILFMTKMNDHLTLAYGAWTPNSQPGDFGGNWDDYGVAVYPIFKYKVSNHPGLFQVIAAYTSKDAVDVGNPRFVPGVITGNPPTKNDNWILEISGEQFLWEPQGVSVAKAEGGRKEEFQVPTKDFAQSQPGFGIFYRLSHTPEDRSAYSLYLSGGIGGRGAIPGRPYDRFGFGPYWVKKSNDLTKLLEPLLRDELGVEAFYNFAITPHMQLSFDSQWIRQGLRSSADAWILGIRLNTRF
jgi:hypothetical protein